MKKIALVFIFISLVVTQCALSYEANDYFTDQMLNGRAFIDEDQNKTNMAFDYTNGCIDTLLYTNSEKILEHYPNIGKGDIINAVKLYYQNNPDQNHIPILKVLLSGAK